jgi:xanthine/uracil/vitamin C permease (AzgA family)
MEWVKLASLRSTWATLGITIAAAAGIAVLAAAGTKSPSQDLTNSMMTGMFAGVLLAGVLGVLAVTGEYTSGTIRATLAAAPRRPLVLAAKATVFGVTTLVPGEQRRSRTSSCSRTALGGIAPRAQPPACCARLC